MAIKFYIGQIVQHTRFNYRGVIIDADSQFLGSDSWYEQVAKSRPPKDKPWYHVLVDGAEQQTYVAERHLVVSSKSQPISHPEVDKIFSAFIDGHYQLLKH